jgi:thiosulfate reductase cytochrome b subunit
MEKQKVDEILLDLTEKVGIVMTQNDHQTRILELLAKKYENHEQRINSLETLVKIGAAFLTVISGVLVWASRVIPTVIEFLMRGD